MLGSSRVQVDTVHHTYMAHMLYTTDDKNITLVGCNLCSCCMNGLHGRTTQTVNGLTGNSFWKVRQQSNITGNIHTLFKGLVYTAPDHVFNFIRVEFVTYHQCTDKFSRHVGTYIAEHTIFRFAHGCTYTINNHNVTWI